MLLAEAGGPDAEWDVYRPCRLLQKLQRTARVIIRSNRGRHLLGLAKSLKKRGKKGIQRKIEGNEEKKRKNASQKGDRYGFNFKNWTEVLRDILNACVFMCCGGAASLSPDTEICALCMFHLPTLGAGRGPVHKAEGSAQETLIKDHLLVGREPLQLEAERSSERRGLSCSLAIAAVARACLFYLLHNSSFLSVNHLSQCFLSFRWIDR